MARPAKFSDDDVLDAALACVGRDGPGVTVQDIAAELGGPVGSIYHRFRSREEIVAKLWMRSVRRFQAGVFELEGDDPHESLLAMAEYVPAYCRTHPSEALALTLHRHDRLLADCPPGLEADVDSLNDHLHATTKALTKRRFGRLDRQHVELVVLAARTVPYGLVRPHLGGPVPRIVDRAARASADAILRLGD